MVSIIIITLIILCIHVIRWCNAVRVGATMESEKHATKCMVTGTICSILIFILPIIHIFYTIYQHM